MTNKTNSILYIGVTDNIEERPKEHKLKKYPDSFTAKDNCNKLIYFEKHDVAKSVLRREKQLEKWRRDWIINLIVDMNSSWIDLTTNWNLNYNKLR